MHLSRGWKKTSEPNMTNASISTFPSRTHRHGCQEMSDPDLRPGEVTCLRCGKLFKSRDVCTNRICPPCTRNNSKEYIPRIIATSVHTGDGVSVMETDGG